MPAARVGRFKFHVSTDDVPLPLALTCALGAALFAVFVPCLVSAHDNFVRFFRDTCAEDLPAYTEAVFIVGYVLASLFGVQLLASSAAVYYGCKGTILQESQRSRTMTYSCVSWIISAIQWPFLGFFIYATASDHQRGCLSEPSSQLIYEGFINSSPVAVLRTASIFGVTVAVFSLLTSFLLLNLYPTFQIGAKTTCSRCAGCVGCQDALLETEGGDDSIGDEVSNIMLRIFGPMPLVASDLFAGMIFLSAYQTRCRQTPTLGPIGETDSETAALPVEVEMATLQQTPVEHSLGSITSLSKNQSLTRAATVVSRPVDVSTLYAAEYFLHYAQAAYGKDTTSDYGELHRHNVAGEELSRFDAVSMDYTPPTKAWANPISEWWSMLVSLTNLPIGTEPPTEAAVAPLEPTPPSAEVKPAMKGKEKDKDLQSWRAILMKQLGLKEEDLLYLQLENKAVGTVPYFLALDRKRHNIVLSIRGSATLQDAFTDMITTPAPMSALLSRGGLWGQLEVPVPSPHSASLEPMPEIDSVEMRQPSEVRSADSASSQGAPAMSMTARMDSIHWQSVIGASAEATNLGAQVWDESTYPGGYAHRGILVSAIRLLDNLKAKGHLGKAVEEHPDWKVVITGHSLGAGLAALLAMALQPDLKERLHCWAYCPPGGLMSVQRALEGSKYITTVIHATDPVSRLTWRSLEMLRDQLMLSLALSKVNKNELWWRCLRHKKRPQLLDPDELLHHSIPEDPDIQSHLHKYKRLTQHAKLLLAGDHFLRFWAPGKIIHLCPQSQGERGVAGDEVARRAEPASYDAKWVSYETIEDEGLVVGRNTINDHDMLAVHAGICSSIARSSPG